MRKLYENFHIFHFQKRIVSAETIRGNTVNTDHRNIITGAPKFVNLPLCLKTICFYSAHKTIMQPAKNHWNERQHASHSSQLFWAKRT